jgi:hypothetical protein
MPRKQRKRSSLANFTRTRKQRNSAPAAAKPKSNAALVGNPPFWQDAVDVIAPGAIAYAGTRLVGRIAFKLAKKKSLTTAKHVGPWSSVAAAAAAWYAVHKIPSLEKYHTPVVVGATIAALQGLLQTYLPQYGWILNDYHLDDPLPGASQAAFVPGANGQPSAPSSTPESTPDDDDLADVLDNGESADDLYTGVFSN